MALTDIQIRTAKPQDKAYTLNDGQGLSLLVEPNGSKGWRFRYRFAGKPKMISFGTYPEVSLSAARQKKAEARELVANNVNPSEIRKTEKAELKAAAANTFEIVAREWHQHKLEGWTAGYASDMLEGLEKDIFPYLGQRVVSEIKPLEVLEVLRRIESRGALERMKKVRQSCGQIFRYAIVTGRAETNPASELTGALKTAKSKHFPHLLAPELPPFLQTLSSYHGSKITQLATRLLMITGVRTIELRAAEWKEFDLDKALWLIPSERMKMRRPHLVPLSHQALDILSQLKEITGRYRLVFTGRNDCTKPMSEAAINQVIKRIGYNGKATGHGFRHTMSTILHEQGYNTAWIETQLAHADKNSIRGTYNHAQYLDGRGEMLQWYADYLDSLEHDGNVVHGSFGKRA
ncbi:tyrosine-type recombinase/integrase [Budviciaceae bacterium BWR-B9]|uniref:Tyrosine-type recombinase/integrase n=1 Tax=Limnobaculum allomyrinae TaxID=2791986 RepID=A0ABS1IMB6_9GAMM|nr:MULTISPECIES: integrase arm-type DNA-binding domain-containing protein [Limnobaculum]MBK5142873.1 tyrosine-type recombinase/integrase [Limnobaculum allomyrinae]MBV7690240.1 tyrosine-type recombinase/integrase [Limnobaculum sp. M2-1]